jgi:hypothetical protein
LRVTELKFAAIANNNRDNRTVFFVHLNLRYFLDDFITPYHLAKDDVFPLKISAKIHRLTKA